MSRSVLNVGLVWTVCVVSASLVSAAEANWPRVTQVERQPLVAATERLVQALEFVGSPLPAEAQQALAAALKIEDAALCAAAIQDVLDPWCVAGVLINPESRVSVVEGEAPKELIQQGWRTFLVKVHNEAGVTAPLKTESPNLDPMYQRGKGPRQRPLTDDKLVTAADLPNRFLDAVDFGQQPLKPNLSGLELEYRILQLYSRDVGRREVSLGFHVGQGTQDLGFRNAVPILFDCLPAVEVALIVRDWNGDSTTAAFVFRDRQGRVYPNPARRLAPDFFFHDQVYRADGETIQLPRGEYTVTVSRGPEYIPLVQSLTVDETVSQRAEFRLERWIYAAGRRWFSGDHHVHAAGCAHYDSPTEGVGPSDMLRHILGEDLNVGCVLSWGPCWYTQKRYFEGKASALSRPLNLMRYDVEVSGFPSSHAGHLCLLRLTEDDYPGTKVLEDWPSWTQPVLAWGREQGGVVGYSHSGWGLVLPDYAENGRRVPNKQGRAADKLPDYELPPFDGIGANEYIVTAANGVCDFISAVDTPSIWELNIWYHTLNCGLTSRISGETDFPCIYGDKVGLGRVYVKLDDDQPLDYDAWIQGVKAGRSYCGDGLSHIIDFEINGLGVGEPNAEGRLSVVSLDKPQPVTVTFDVAARLEPEVTPATEAIRNKRLDEKPYWHLERCRIGNTRQVPVEIVVNGEAVQRFEVDADGEVVTLSHPLELKESSWVAVRILPSVHTNPIFVEVGGRPIHASRRSAEWCRKAVDICWNQKMGRIRESERNTAKAAYDQAAAYYDAVKQTATGD